MQKNPQYNGYENSNNPDLEAHANVSRQAAADGMVLLENNNAALPFDRNIKKVAAFGNTSYDIISGGTGSGDVKEAYTVSLDGGLINAGYEADSELKSIYDQYINDYRMKAINKKNSMGELLGGKIPVEEMPMTKTIATRMAANTDVALITIGRNSGEAGDREAEEGDFYLTKTEKDLVKIVSESYHAKGKKVIVILNVGGVIETASWSKIPDAVLLAWQPGQEAGNSIIDVLSGKVNPSGKLAVSFPISYDDTPTAKNFPGRELKNGGPVDNTPDLSGYSLMKRVSWEVTYEEDIYVGYRYYNTFKIPVAYEFGYGKSYTTFEYSNLKLSSDNFNDTITLTIEVKNTGTIAGREVVQVYAGAPSVKLEKPEMELVAFGKTTLLQPGESENMSFTVDAATLASFDESSSSWVIEAGKYQIKVGASATDIKLADTFNVGNEINVEKVSNSLAPLVEINKLHQ